MTCDPRNFVSHLVTLHQANVLTGETMYRAIGHIQVCCTCTCTRK